MELRHLRYFVAVSEHLSFSEAASATHVTQSTVSHQIKQLEHELGFKLFERSYHKIRLTSKGEILLPRVINILKDLDDTIRLSKDEQIPPEGHLRILVSVRVMIEIMPETIRRFRELCPNVSIVIDEVFSNVLLDRFETGDYHLGLGAFEQDIPFTHKPLCKEELVLVVPPDHPMASRKRVRMIDLHGEPLLSINDSFAARLQMNRCFEDVGATPQIVAEFDNPGTLMSAIVDLGVGGIVPPCFPEWMKNINLVKVHLEDPTPSRTISLFWKDSPLSVAAQIFSDVISDQVRDSSRRNKRLGLHPL